LPKKKEPTALSYSLMVTFLTGKKWWGVGAKRGPAKSKTATTNKTKNAT